MQAVMASLRVYGQHQPIVVQKQGMIVRVGNARLEAARLLGWDTIAAVVVDETDIQAVARAIADNRTSELAEWDFSALAGSLRALQEASIDLGDLGWQDYDLQPILGGFFDPPPVDNTDSSHENKKPVGKKIEFTQTQFAAVMTAVARWRSQTGDPTITDGAVVVCICEKFLGIEKPS